ncbi:unnamed protein product [Rodentolepis nana]|uniref:DNA-directed DNA polymerase n=1 Tax=Rodentolepis nana TaxID=102285 RepID=A0A0R3TW95_RODNA|nr:unnamed protein product [Rodentolepis nana]
MDSSSRPRRVSQKKENRLELLKRIREAKERGERFVVMSKLMQRLFKNELKMIGLLMMAGFYSMPLRNPLGGLGYADDGREIFDDHDGDLEEEESHNKPHRGSTSSKKKTNPDIRSSVSTKGGSKDIRSMFSTSASRQKKRIMDAGAEDAALDDLLAELDTDIQNDPPLKKLKVDKPRKSLPIKSVSQPQAVVAKPRRETSHYPKSRPPQSQSSTTSRPRNPYSVKPQPAEVIIAKPSPVNQETVTQTVHISEPMEDDFEDHDFPVAETDEVQHSPEKELESDIPAITNWLNEEGEDAEASFVEMDNSGNSTAIDDSGALRFFWLDAYEDVKNQQGVVFLFGKIPCKDDPTGFCSCCVRLKDLERRLFFLPRPDSQYTVKDVYGELRELSGQWKIGKFKCKPTTKKYCFDLTDVPSECEYLEVRYSATYPSLPPDLTGKTFSRVFGTSASFLENLVLDLKLRGPCWLEIKGAVPLQPQLSWCKVDYDFSSQQPNKITKLADVVTNPPPAPPIRMVVLDVKSVVRKKSNSAEIISVGVLIDNHFHLDRPAGKKAFQSHYLVLAPPKDSVLPYDLSRRLPTWGPQYQVPSTGAENAPLGGVDVEPNERALLGRLLTRIHKLDPDLIIGHDLWGNQLDLLVHRLISHKVAHWHRIGRLRRSAHFTVNFNRVSFLNNALKSGPTTRIHCDVHSHYNTAPWKQYVCDTRISSRELVRSRTYNLSELTFQILGGDAKSRRHVPAPVARQFASSATAALFSGKAPVAAAPDIDEALISGVDLEVDSADLRCLFLTANGVKDLIDFSLSDALLVLRLAHQLQMLTKNPEDYPDAKSQPHVQVALRFNQSIGSGGGGGHRFRAGDTVEYIICEDGTTRSAVQRAYSPAELSSGIKPSESGEESKNKEPRQLKVDIHYYLASQIHPVVSRLVAPIEGTSPAHIADCLGLDSASYRRSMATSAAINTGGDEDALQEASDSGSMFQGAFLNDADPLTISCTALRDGKRCQGKALIRSSPFTQAGLATWVVSYSFFLLVAGFIDEGILCLC